MKITLPNQLAVKTYLRGESVGDSPFGCIMGELMIFSGQSPNKVFTFYFGSDHVNSKDREGLLTNANDSIDDCFKRAEFAKWMLEGYGHEVELVEMTP